MRRIDDTLKNKLAQKNFYQRCCLRDLENCGGRIEWHHNLIFQGRQVNEEFCILPVCKKHHHLVYDSKVKEKMNYIMLKRASCKQLKRYSKVIDYCKLKNQLIKKYERD